MTKSAASTVALHFAEDLSLFAAFEASISKWFLHVVDQQDISIFTTPRSYEIRYKNLIFTVMMLSSCCKSDLEFTDLLGQKISPDGEISAAYVVQNFGFGGSTTFGIAVSGKASNPLNGEPIIIESEDGRPINYDWKSSNILQVQLTCGWWSRLTNHYQLPGTSRIIDIIYTPPRDCTGQKYTPSNSMPN